MNQETKTCQNCKNKFTIEPEDFSFYQKIQVPPPTFCPECRMQRRLVWRNEKTLYKRKCDAPGHNEDIISVYSQDKPFVVYDQNFWYSDKWDPMDYSKEYDLSKPFFEQFYELLKTVPLIALFDSKSVNSPYCNITVEHKNCYLVTAGWGNEDSYYSNRISYCRDTMDSYICHKTELSYENVYCKDSYQLFFSRNSEHCNNSYFLYDCRNCSHCIGCTSLRNKQYHIFNKPHTKEEYFQALKELDLGSIKTINELKVKFYNIYLKAIHRYAHLTNTINVIGDNVEKSKNCYYCFDLAGDAENSKFAHWGTYKLKDSYDTGAGTAGNSELLYEGISIGVNNSRCKFGVVVWYSHDVQYSFGCQNSHDLFGCVGLRNKQYCIFNKQYTKEEYEKMVIKITWHMNEMPYKDKKGRIYKYGEFFPAEMSPSAYNEAVSQDYMPLTKEQAKQQGYPWKDPEERNIQVTITYDSIPDNIKDIDDSIFKEIIECEHQGKCNESCVTAFKIIPQELQFYKRMNLPLSRLCPNCRHYQRIKQRNPLKLWYRQCQCGGATSENGVYQNTTSHNHHKKDHCPNEFETTYASERKEIVYCEKCYQEEVV